MTDKILKFANFIRYHFYCLLKLIMIFIIGSGSVFLAVCIFPLIRIFSFSKDKFKSRGRRFISASFKGFVFFLRISGIVKVKISREDKIKLKTLKSKIIVANHPSILDVVILMSIIPGPDCIVGQQYAKTILGGVIKQVFILSSINIESLFEICKKTIDSGNNVLIFPEGTRTPQIGNVHYKKGAARIASYCNTDIQVLLISGTDKRGLQKHNPFWSYNTKENLVYEIRVLEEIKINDYKNLPSPVSAKRITEKIVTMIQDAENENRRNSPFKTFNAV